MIGKVGHTCALRFDRRVGGVVVASPLGEEFFCVAREWYRKVEAFL